MNVASRIPVGVLLLLLAAIALLTPLLAPDPHLQDLGASLRAPAAGHWLGTDHLGRDNLARLGEGLRTSVGLALASALLAVAMGTGLGLLAAMHPGWVDRAVSAAADGVASIPGLLWVLLIAAFAPGQKWVLYTGLVLTAWVEFYRLMRSRGRSALLGQRPRGCSASGLLTCSGGMCCGRCCRCSRACGPMRWPTRCWPSRHWVSSASACARRRPNSA